MSDTEFAAADPEEEEQTAEEASGQDEEPESSAPAQPVVKDFWTKDGKPIRHVLDGDRWKPDPIVKNFWTKSGDAIPHRLTADDKWEPVVGESKPLLRGSQIGDEAPLAPTGLERLAGPANAMRDVAEAVLPSPEPPQAPTPRRWAALEERKQSPPAKPFAIPHDRLRAPEVPQAAGFSRARFVPEDEGPPEPAALARYNTLRAEQGLPGYGYTPPAPKPPEGIPSREEMMANEAAARARVQGRSAAALDLSRATTPKDVASEVKRLAQTPLAQTPELAQVKTVAARVAQDVEPYVDMPADKIIGSVTGDILRGVGLPGMAEVAEELPGASREALDERMKVLENENDTLRSIATAERTVGKVLEGFTTPRGVATVGALAVPGVGEALTAEMIYDLGKQTLSGVEKYVENQRVPVDIAAEALINALMAGEGMRHQRPRTRAEIEARVAALRSKLAEVGSDNVGELERLIAHEQKPRPTEELRDLAVETVKRIRRRLEAPGETPGRTKADAAVAEAAPAIEAEARRRFGPHEPPSPGAAPAPRTPPPGPPGISPEGQGLRGPFTVPPDIRAQAGPIPEAAGRTPAPPPRGVPRPNVGYDILRNEELQRQRPEGGWPGPSPEAFAGAASPAGPIIPGGAESRVAPAAPQPIPGGEAPAGGQGGEPGVAPDALARVAEELGGEPGPGLRADQGPPPPGRPAPGTGEPTRHLFPVDELGQPIEVYRGEGRKDEKGGSHLSGSHWTEDRSYAALHGAEGRPLRTATLDIKRPFDYEGEIPPDVVSAITGTPATAPVLGVDLHKGLRDEALGRILGDEAREPTQDELVRARDAAKDRIQAAGFDGYAYKVYSPGAKGKVRAWAVFDPKQIREAAPKAESAERPPEKTTERPEARGGVQEQAEPPPSHEDLLRHAASLADRAELRHRPPSPEEIADAREALAKEEGHAAPEPTPSRQAAERGELREGEPPPRGGAGAPEHGEEPRAGEGLSRPEPAREGAERPAGAAGGRGERGAEAPTEVGGEPRVTWKTAKIVPTRAGVVAIPEEEPLERVTLKTEVDEKPHEVPAERVVPGLAVHESLSHPTRWTLSHETSGLKVGDFPSRALAIKAARRIAPLTDYTTDAKQLIATKGPAFEALREINHGKSPEQKEGGDIVVEKPARGVHPEAARKFREAIAAKDVDKLTEYLESSNPGLRKMFEDETGVKLPTLRGRRKEALRKWARESAVTTEAPEPKLEKEAEHAAPHEEARPVGARGEGPVGEGRAEALRPPEEEREALRGAREGEGERPGALLEPGPERRPPERGADVGAGVDASARREERAEPAAPVAGEHEPERGGGAERGRSEVPKEARGAEDHPSASNSGGDFRFPSAEAASEHAAAGARTRVSANLRALRLLQTLKAEGRPATSAEQAELAKFSGWGSFPGVFRQGSDLWDKGQELRQLLTDDEWAAARASTLNAHYTDPHIVSTMWDIAKRLGFRGGRFLEPSMGIGNFLSLMPPEVRGRSRVTGVELDKTTGEMAKLLFPNSNIEVKGFQDLAVPDGFYDFASSNVPFGDFKVHDKDYDRFGANIHDYFFLKSLDKVRPGGALAFITSTGTLDKLSPKIREALVEKGADLVAAMRLPGKTFQKSAGTDVVTDIVILRKRLPGEEPSGPAWTSVSEVPDPDGGAPIPVNEYFAQHPEMVLGRLDRGGTMYRGGTANVSATPDFEKRLAAAIEKIPQGVITPRKQSAAFEPKTVAAAGNAKVGGYVVQGGRLYVRIGDMMQEESAKPDAIRRIEKMTGLRDIQRELYDAQLTGKDDAVVGAARKRLGAAYDAFVSKHGPLHSRANTDAFDEDPDAPMVLALENFDAKTGKASKSDIFTKNTIRAYEARDSASTPADAISISLRENGRLDVERVAKLLGTTEEAVGKDLVSKGLAYDDPSEGWTPSDLYLSGNVRKKLLDARAAAAADKRYAPNVAALEKVQPEDIDFSDIHVRLGAPWLPPSDYEDFMEQILGGTHGDVKAGYNPVTGGWSFDYTTRGKNRHAGRSPDSQIYGTQRVPFMKLMDAAANGTEPVVKDHAGEGEPPKVNIEETAAAKAKLEEIRSAFADWVWADRDRRLRLSRFYNDSFNNIRSTKYDASHYKADDGQYHFPGMNPAIRLKEHQANAVWQIVSTGRALLGHEVGTGKTFTGVTAAMESRRLRLANKPLIVVPNARIDGFAEEARQLYPGAKILVTGESMGTTERKRTVAKIATGDWDMVIMTHPNLDGLPMRPEVQQRFIQQEIDELEAAKEASQAQDASKGNRVVKELEKARARLEARLEELIEGKKEKDPINFEDLGVDMLIVDEAHGYKSLPVYTAKQGLKGVPTDRSQRATNMLMRTRWLQEQNGGRGVVFMTGTPIDNTLAELYNMQRYLQPNELKERGLQSFDAWSNTFTTPVTTMEMKATGDYAPVTRLAEFVNVRDLEALSHQFLDPQFADQVEGLKRPKRKDEVITAPMSDRQRGYLDILRGRAEKLKQQAGRPEKGADNFLNITTDARKSAMDMRLIDERAVDNPDSKVNRAVAEVLKIQKAHPDRTQLIFSDFGVGAGKTNFSVYRDITKKLVAGGIPREKIVDFSDMTDAERDTAISRLQSGEALVGIGSTEKLGTGVNVQNKLYAVHHLDVPWTPARLEQRDGRIWRQGNTNSDIRIIRYTTEGSFDTNMWQTVDRKSRFIKQFMRGGFEGRTFRDEDGEALSYAQIMAVTSGSPELLEKIGVAEDVKGLERAEKRHARLQAEFQDTVAGAVTAEKARRARIERYSKDIALADQYPAMKKDEPFEAVVDDRRYTDPQAAGEALKRAFARETNAYRYDTVRAGTYRGFGIDVSRQGFRLVGNEEHSVNMELDRPESIFRSADSVLSRIPQKIAAEENEIALTRRSAEKAAAEIGKPFAQKETLNTKRARLTALDKILEEKAKAEAEARKRRAAISEEPPPAEPEPEEEAFRASAARRAEPEPEEPPERPRPTALPKAEPILTAPPFAPGKEGRLGEVGLRATLAERARRRDTEKQALSAEDRYYDKPNRLEPERAAGGRVEEIARKWESKADELAAAGNKEEAKYRRTKAKELREHAEQIDFIDRIERGVGQATLRAQRVADYLKKAWDARKEEIAQAGMGAAREWHLNYFPHIWVDPKAVENWVTRIFYGRRPLEGGKSFAQHRVFPTTMDGLEAGFVPVDWNPIRLSMLKMAEMDRYITARKFLADLDRMGMTRFLRIKEKLEGWRVPQDGAFQVHKSPWIAVKEAFDEGLMEKLRDFAGSLGVSIETKQALGQGRWGIARGDKEVLRRFGGPESIVSHELGHVLDHKFKLYDRLLKADPDIERELAALARERISEETEQADPKERERFEAYIQRPGERTANLIHAFVHAPELAESTAPRAVAALKAIVQGEPDLAPLLDIKPSLKVTSAEGAVHAGGIVKTGGYAVPEPIADMLDRHLTPSLLQGVKPFEMYRKASNALLMSRLGWSGFHLGFTTGDVTLSRLSLAARQASRGDVTGALKALESLPTVFSGWVKDNPYLKEWYAPGTQGEDVAAVVKALEMGGMRARQSDLYDLGAWEGFFRDLRKAGVANEGERGARALDIAAHPGAIAKEVATHPVKSAMAAIEAGSRYILHYIVPRQKMAVAAQLAEAELRMLGKERGHGGSLKEILEASNPERVKDIMARVVDAVDDRMGQIVYDNLFLNRTIKDVLHASVQSVGWNWGSVRHLGGGVADVRRLFKPETDVTGKELPRVSHRLAYTLLLPVFHAMLSSAIQYLYTGKGPDEKLDLVFPKNGRTNPDGTPQRLSPATYMKDVVAYLGGFVGEGGGIRRGFEQAGRTVGHKMNPMLSMLKEVLVDNQDYYGTEIVDKDAPAVTQLAQLAAYVGKGFQPYSWQGMEKEMKSGEGVLGSVPALFGLAPAPASVSRSAFAQHLIEYQREHMPRAARTHAQAEKADVRRDILRAAHEGDLDTVSRLSTEALSRGTFDEKYLSKLMHQTATSSQQKILNSMPTRDALKAYRMGTEREKELAKPILVRKLKNKSGMSDVPLAERPAFLRDAWKTLGVELE